MISQKKPLRTYFPEYETGAIFSAMQEAPWTADNAGLQLDIAYFSSWSGDKPATKFVQRNSVDGAANVSKIAEILWKLYGASWKRLYEAYNVEYNPTDNYNVLETIERSQNNNTTTDTNGSVNTTTESTGKDITTEEETTKTEYGKVDTVNGKTDNYAYGFNSQSQVPTTVVIDTSTDTQSGSDSTTRNGTTTVDSTNKGTSGTITGEKEVETGEESENISRNRTGNIGQTSYQDLLRQELELRKWNFFRQLFSDCDSVLVLSIYDPCLLDSVN